MTIVEFFNFEPFINASLEAIENLGELFLFFRDIAISFFNRIDMSATFLYSFIIILFSIWVVSTCITIWRH